MSRAHPRRPSRRATRRGLVLSAVGALALAATLVWQSAYAGFTDSTGSVSATVATGTVALTNDVEGWPALSLDAMRPGDSGTECIRVTSTGSEPAQVRLYAKDRTNTALNSYITLRWTAGTGTGTGGGDCTGFVSNGVTVSTSMGSFGTSYNGGILAWNTNGGTETRTYQLTYTFSDNPPASLKGTSGRITFVWEAQNR